VTRRAINVLIIFSLNLKGPGRWKEMMCIFLTIRYSVILEGSQEQQTLASTTLNLINLS